MSRPPKFGRDVIDRDQLRRMREDGDKKRRARKEMQLPGAIAAPFKKAGKALGVFTKQQRTIAVHSTEAAVHALADRDAEGWLYHLRNLVGVMKAAGFRLEVVRHTCKEIEHEAVRLSGDRGIYRFVAEALTRDRVISIHGQRPGLAGKKEQGKNDPLQTVIATEPARAGAERGAADGEARRQQKGVRRPEIRDSDGNGRGQ